MIILKVVFQSYLGKHCKIPYGSGSVFGFFSQDHVRVGDFVIKDQVEFFDLIAQSFIHALKYVMFSLHSCYVSSYPSGICRGYSGRIFSILNNRV